MQLITLRGGFDDNLCYIVSAPGRSEAALIDAAIEAETILQALDRHALRLTHVLITHGHADHFVSAKAVLERTGATLCAFKASNVLHEVGEARTRPLRDGSRITVCEDAEHPLVFEALFTPGHAPDHLCYHLGAEAALFTGDALFIGRPGRTASPPRASGRRPRG